MSVLNTSNPVALRYLFDETLFVFEGEHQQQSEVDIRPQTVTPQAKEEIAAVSTVLKSWGLNQKNILFVHHSPNHENLEPTAMDAFLKILGALKLQEGDVALINLAQQGMEGHVFDFLDPSPPSGKLIFLGQGLDTEMKMSENQNRTDYLQTYSFDEMLADESKKRQFWNDLKVFLT